MEISYAEFRGEKAKETTPRELRRPEPVVGVPVGAGKDKNPSLQVAAEDTPEKEATGQIQKPSTSGFLSIVSGSTVTSTRQSTRLAQRTKYDMDATTQPPQKPTEVESSAKIKTMTKPNWVAPDMEHMPKQKTNPEPEVNTPNIRAAGSFNSGNQTGKAKNLRATSKHYDVLAIVVTVLRAPLRAGLAGLAGMIVAAIVHVNNRPFDMLEMVGIRFELQHGR
ncbi:hypothetical protein QBC38DRAFT_456382 [Podospora fimiseda]|uniref:Uncharacterized protein n=1 Tax=Podospora fimiseda TaxID=252190 RepID=A0AAN7BMW9_9PEZI|nr:hypothetical protein QBC38DRAFT_456382 [Podospora fimiseda]